MIDLLLLQMNYTYNLNKINIAIPQMATVLFNSFSCKTNEYILQVQTITV